ncbi:transposase [Thermopirellula anaerolimosa]
MQIPNLRPLFAWDTLEDSPTIRTLREFLTSIPDEEFLASLERSRGKGRNDYPVRVLWGTWLLKIALRHPTVESCLAELRRNAELRKLIGIESEDRVPNAWNMSRFMELLGREPFRSLLQEMFNTMVRRLGEVVPDLGENLAGDATGLKARRKEGEAAEADTAQPARPGLAGKGFRLIRGDQTSRDEFYRRERAFRKTLRSGHLGFIP